MKTKNKSGLGSLIQFYKKHWGFFVGYVSLLIIKAVLSFLSAMFIANMIACIMDEANYDKALIYAGICLGVAVLNCLCSILNTYFFKQLENRTKIDIQQMVLKRSLDIQMKNYDTMGSGIIVTRLTSDIKSLSTEFKSFTTRVIDLLVKVSYVVYIFFLNYWLGLVLVGTIVLTIIMSRIRLHYFNKYKPGVRQAAEKVNSKIIEVVRGVKDVKTLNCADTTLELMNKDQLSYSKQDNFEWYLGITLSNMTSIMKHLCNFAFIALAIYFLRIDSLTPLIFYTCYLYKDHMLDFAQILEDLQMNLGTANVYAQRIFKLTDSTVYSIDIFGDKYIENYSGSIEFKDVCFSYEGENKKLVLDRTSFEIKPRQTVAFVGESGCGKSTVINLIAHLYYKNSGQILYDGVAIEELSRDFIKNNIAVVNQFPYIFNLSIRDNFKLIKTDITDEEIFSLCEKTRILDFIKTLPLGLDSVIGENGCQFSGGQKQKLCIARALARDVKILIFDEATSALDNANQMDIMKVIEDLKSKMTVILIAHRLSTITYADCIYLMKDGKVVAQGKHSQLMKSNESYKKLYNNSKNEKNKKAVE